MHCGHSMARVGTGGAGAQHTHTETVALLPSEMRGPSGTPNPLTQRPWLTAVAGVAVTLPWILKKLGVTQGKPLHPQVSKLC